MANPESSTKYHRQNHVLREALDNLFVILQQLQPISHATEQRWRRRLIKQGISAVRAMQLRQLILDMSSSKATEMSELLQRAPIEVVLMRLVEGSREGEMALDALLGSPFNEAVQDRAKQLSTRERALMRHLTPFEQRVALLGGPDAWNEVLTYHPPTGFVGSNLMKWWKRHYRPSPVPPPPREIPTREPQMG